MQKTGRQILSKINTLKRCVFGLALIKKYSYSLLRVIQMKVHYTAWDHKPKRTSAHTTSQFF